MRFFMETVSFIVSTSAATRVHDGAARLRLGAPAYPSIPNCFLLFRCITHHTKSATATSVPIRADGLPLAVAVSVSVATPASSSRLAASAVAPPRGSLRALLPCRGVRAAPLLRVGTRSRGASVVCEAQGQDTAIQVPDVTKSTWQSLIVESELPVLVEFWASWCGPCKMIDPVIGKLSKEYEGKLKCYKLNTDENPDIATQFGIRSIPTMLIFKNGEKKDTVIGAVPESTLVICIEKYVKR